MTGQSPLLYYHLFVKVNEPLPVVTLTKFALLYVIFMELSDDVAVLVWPELTENSEGLRSEH